MNEPVLDPAVLETLRELTPPGEPDVMAQVLRLFQDEAPKRMARLREAAAAADAAGLHRVAHSLKGSAANIGARPLAAACRTLDDRARVGDLTDAAPLIDEVARELRRVEDEITRRLGQVG